MEIVVQGKESDIVTRLMKCVRQMKNQNPVQAPLVPRKQLIQMLANGLTGPHVNSHLIENQHFKSETGIVQLQIVMMLCKKVRVALMQDWL